MPVMLLERLPLPNLKTYTSISVLLLVSAIFYAHNTVTMLKEIGTYESEEAIPEEAPADATEAVPNDAPAFKNITLKFDSHGWNMFHVLATEVWCIWTLINMAYCCLILLGKLIQKAVFGDLRVSEKQHLKDRFWNLVFYKFIFVFGVMNVQTMDEVVLWIAWFSVLSFFYLLTQLCKDRFEYLSFSPTNNRWSHVKLLSLLFVILLSCCGLLAVCVFIGFYAGLTIFCFVTAECLLLSIRATHVVVRYAIYLYDMALEGVWENRSSFVYYIELVFELTSLSIDFAHHLHMMLWGNIFLSMASLVICMQLRYLFSEFQRRIKRHKNYRRVVMDMESRFPMASREDIASNSDICSVCWEKMESARKLTCNHMFHNSCLISWLEQDTSCPICRLPLNDHQEDDPNGNQPDARGDAENNMPQTPRPNQTRTNHFFHFDGSRYVSWLPSFSVEVTHPQLNRLPPMPSSQLDNMARTVHGMFSHIPINVIREDLRSTRSIDETVDRILDGVVSAPSANTFDGRTPFSQPANSARPNAADTETTPATTEMQASSPSDVDTPTRQTHLFQTMAAEAAPNLPVEGASDPRATESSEHPAFLTGSRFSKSSLEREAMLEERKKSMVEQARRRFLESTAIPLQAPPPADSSEAGDITVRRRQLSTLP